MSERLRELLDRMIEPGPKCHALSASETHEIHDAVMEVLDRDRLLAAAGFRIFEQDNRCTDQPMFVVFQKRDMVAHPDYDHDRIVWVDEDGDEAVTSGSEALEALNDGADEITVGGVTWRRIAVKEIDEFVTACFTEKACQEYLEVNGHNLRQPFIYAAGSFRNREFQQLRSAMLHSAGCDA